MADSRLYFRQVLAGMDIAEHDPIAQQMVNFVYLIGDRETGEAVVVDPAYDPQAILDLVEADGMRLVGALGSHFHADHVGGNLFGNEIVGIADLLERVDVPIHLQSEEVDWVTRTTGVSSPGNSYSVSSSRTSISTSSRSSSSSTMSHLFNATTIDGTPT